MKFQNSFKFPKTFSERIFCCDLLQDILKEWDKELAWHDREAQRNK